jgi:cell wall-associated NlpC family hydrolase
MRSGALVLTGALTLTVIVPLTAQTARAADATAPSTTTATAVATTVARSQQMQRPAYRLAYGSRGKLVWKLEKKLRMSSPDVVFGGATVKRVKQIERWGGLARDGVVDPATEAVINKYVAKKRAELREARKAAAAKGRTLDGRLGKIVKAARNNFGRPYARGGAGPRAFDCSGFTRYVVRQALGKSLPHQSSAQRGAVKKISRAQAKPGDLVFFHGRGGIYHVGIYAGKGKLFHASRPGTRSGVGPIFSSSITFGRVA